MKRRWKAQLRDSLQAAKSALSSMNLSAAQRAFEVRINDFRSKRPHFPRYG